MRLNQARLATAALILGWMLFAATVCAGLAALWWGFDLFVHFRVQYCIAGLVLGAALWALRRRRMAALAAVLAIVNAAAIFPLLFAPARAVPAGVGAPLRIVSINVFGYNGDSVRVFDYVRREHPDVLVLLEVTPAWERALAQLRSEFGFQWIKPTGQRAGMAVLSREQPIQTREVDLGATDEPSLLLTLQRSQNQRISVLGTHLYWPLGSYASLIRNRQLASIANLARAHEGPLIVAGDLNITPFSPHFARLQRDGNLHNCANGVGIEPTWPARVAVLFIQIDHCLVSPGLSVADFRVGPYVGSDHYPIAMDVRPVSSSATAHAPGAGANRYRSP